MKTETKPSLSWLENPEVFAVNRLDAHSDHQTYRSEDEIMEKKSSLRQSLNGEWDLHYAGKISEAPFEALSCGEEVNFPDRIIVPGHAELQGFGPVQYINTLYPWDGISELRPPYIDPERTPVLTYRKRFVLEPALQGKDIRIRFEGVEKAFYLYLNGKFVGYAEDSFTPSDFDLTPYLKDENELVVQVFKQSSASWLEDQDFFRFSGIFRDVTLYACPAVSVEDMYIRTELEGNTGKLSLDLKMVHPDADFRAELAIFDGEKPLLNETLAFTEQESRFLSQEFTLPDITPWSNTQPVLYSLRLMLSDSEGKPAGIIPYSIGFRNIAIEDGILKLNGERLVFHGVNRHEWNPKSGRVISEEDMRKAMATYRKNHINASRCSHYPNQTRWYELCDENGIYLIDETNLETHGSWMKLGQVEPSWNVPGDDPVWREAVLDRARNMYLRDRNHPSVLIWSLGNESYAGENLKAMSDFLRKADPSRPVSYEGVYHHRKYAGISDFESVMYTSPEEAEAYLENHPEKPYLEIEYMHAMGNSIGGMESYIALEDQYPQYAGGFIWDYMDQALWRIDGLGRDVLGYGGDFSDRPTDYHFSANGIVDANGFEKPFMQEVAFWFQDKAARDQQKSLDEETLQKEMKRIASTDFPDSQKFEIIRGDGGFGVHTDTRDYLFSIPEAGLVSMKKDGIELIGSAPKLSFTRGYTENDLGCHFDKQSAIWEAVEQSFVLKDVQLEDQDGFLLTYRFDNLVLPEIMAEIRYTVEPSGRLKIEAEASLPEGQPDLACFGLRFTTDKRVQKTAWFGRGGESYPDRKFGSPVGEHEEIPYRANYLFPQEYAGHEETLRAALHMNEGILNLKMAEKPFHFSLTPYSREALKAASHQEELGESDYSFVGIFSQMRGVGGIDSWKSDVEEAYRIPSAGKHDLCFLMD